MSDERDPTNGDDGAMRALLKRSLTAEAPSKPVLGEVQRKLRERSKGKFYGDGWSTTQARVSYGLIGAVMLLIVVIAYLLLGPMGFTK